MIIAEKVAVSKEGAGEAKNKSGERMLRNSETKYTVSVPKKWRGGSE